jgi:iron uptake system component EfeO
LAVATVDLQLAAPTHQGRGWDARQDAAAIESMKSAWIRARGAYEHVEGAVSQQNPDLDFALDARYDQYLARTGPDSSLFDDQGVTGMDAVERILWSDTSPASTLAYEKTLVGYVPAAFPATEQEAADFKNRLCAKLASDSMALEQAWSAQTIDLVQAFAGLVALIKEQQDEVDRAAQGAEESRYSQRTMEDLRANVDGTQAIYGLFRPWITSKPGGGDSDAKIESGIDQVQALYGAVPGSAVPPVPPSWSAQSPSPQDLQSTYGQLYVGVAATATISSEMNRAAQLVSLE